MFFESQYVRGMMHCARSSELSNSAASIDKIIHYSRSLGSEHELDFVIHELQRMTRTRFCYQGETKRDITEPTLCIVNSLNDYLAQVLTYVLTCRNKIGDDLIYVDVNQSSALKESATWLDTAGIKLLAVGYTVGSHSAIDDRAMDELIKTSQEWLEADMLNRVWVPRFSPYTDWPDPMADPHCEELIRALYPNFDKLSLHYVDFDGSQLSPILREKVDVVGRSLEPKIIDDCCRKLFEN